MPMPLRFAAPWLLLISANVLVASSSASKPLEVRCSSGAWVDKEERCAAFYKFSGRDEDTKDARILKAYGHQATQVRSIALIVGVSIYGEEFSGGSLPAAHADVERLKTFLVDQQFDEIIVLENEAASKEAIGYFLNTYIPKEARSFQRRARVLFAFSGHGVQDGPDTALALTNARTTSDADGLYSLQQLQGDLRAIAVASWQTLALIDACYGGDIFDTGHVGGNPYVYWEKAAHVITAGEKGSLSWTLGEAKGSVFFQAFIDGIEKGTANSMPIQSRDPQRPDIIIDHGNVVTQGQALAEATRVIHNVETGITKSEGIDLAALSPPWVGSIMPAAASPGAFFFLAGSSRPKVTSIATAVPVTGSSVIRWTAPVTTPVIGNFTVRGIDVSHHSGVIDWDKVKKSGIDFAYVRATYSGDRQDQALQRNLDQLHVAGMPHGVFLVYDFCKDPDAQAEALLRIVPSGKDMLPAALDVEWYEGYGGGNGLLGRQLACANADKKRTADNLIRVLRRLTLAYGKTPIIYIASNSRELLDARFDSYPRWTADMSQRSLIAGRPRDPKWSIWQYDDGGMTKDHRIPGVPGFADLNVFAGDRTAFERFAGTGSAPP